MDRLPRTSISSKITILLYFKREYNVLPGARSPGIQAVLLSALYCPGFGVQGFRLYSFPLCTALGSRPGDSGCTPFRSVLPWARGPGIQAVLLSALYCPGLGARGFRLYSFPLCTARNSEAGDSGCTLFRSVLPGTRGTGIQAVIFGRHKPKQKLNLSLAGGIGFHQRKKTRNAIMRSMLFSSFWSALGLLACPRRKPVHLCGSGMPPAPGP